ncbi:6-aminohexanoate-dimer hydrolase [Pseudocercospora fuligena]|uniref:6-aminohexanoate-dimer hydrolase n=1 Tax=Pseudocercospora fuligena TaxID=685502 RepID=A0A8H6RSG3_9PEZI|nr:6-aminohexanoate-dimer hydrolase [Pseudocercospora fuligena]
MPDPAINRYNWREADHSIWSFQNVNKILPVHMIAKSSTPAILKDDHISFEAFKVETLNRESLNISEYLKQTETDGIVVLRDNKIVFEHYDRTNSRESVHATFSITKSVTGLLSGILVSKGLLDVDANVASYVPEVQDIPYEHVKIRQLLDMRAGIDYDETQPEFRKGIGKATLKLGEETTDVHTFIEGLRAPRSHSIDDPDVPFHYLSMNADLMGWVLERASGKKFADLLSELVWQPLGADSDAYIATDPAGNARTAGGLCATVRDLARLGNAMIQPNSIIPETWTEDMIANGSENAFAVGPEKELFEGHWKTPAYRSFWTADKDRRTLLASGLYGQMLLVDRRNGIVLAKTCSQPEREDLGKFHLDLRAFEQIVKILAH